MGDLEGLKRVLRSLVVSTPTTIDAATLLRDYRRMVGGPLPVASYGYRDPVLFLREQCADSFLFQGPQSNPVLTLIVNKSIKHIDQLVQSQRIPKQLKGKRRSVPESIRYTRPTIANIFIPSQTTNKFSFTRSSSPAFNPPSYSRPQPTYPEPARPEPAPSRPVRKAGPHQAPDQHHSSSRPVVKSVSPKPVTNDVRSGSVEQLSARMESLSNGHREPPGAHEHREPAGAHALEHREPAGAHAHEHREPESAHAHEHREAAGAHAHAHRGAAGAHAHGHREPAGAHAHGHREPAGAHAHEHREPASAHRRLQQYLEAYRSQQVAHGSAESLRNADTDSRTQTSSSSRERSAAALAQLQGELARLVVRQPGPVPCSQLYRLYEEEYGRELDFARFGFKSVSACACAVEALTARRAADGEWLLSARDASPPPPALRLRRARAEHASRASLAPLDPDDALPGIDYAPDVFPADCLSFLESIPAGSVADVAPGDMLPVLVGEVYSPSHLWLLRQGPDYDTMDEYMDQMKVYYTSGLGADRVLAAGARRPGQYCSSVYDSDWHRSLIVQVLDADTVKVRHVDYGTVDTVAAGSLRVLPRRWAALPALAVRAMLAGLRPAAASRRWPRAAAAHCLDLVRDRTLVANVVAVDHEEDILEVFLIDTSTEEDVNITEQMIRAGHADPRTLPALGTRECYLFPLFRVLEAGETPNYAEINRLLRDGIALEFVDSYRRHVPALLPSDDTLDDDDTRRAADTSELGSSAGPSPSPSPPPASFSMLLPSRDALATSAATTPSPSPSPPSRVAGNRVPLSMLLPARKTLAAPAWVSVTSVATSTSSPPATPLPPPPTAIPKVFTFSARPAAPSAGAGEPESVTSTLAPSLTSLAAPPPAPSGPTASGLPPTRGSSLHINGPPQTNGGPQTDSSCCVSARPAHPAAVYALPYCPCSAAGPCCPRPPPPYASAPYPYAAYRPEPPRPLFYYQRPPLPQYARQFAAAAGGDGASVRLSAAECEVFEKLSRVDPATAHRYMMEALQRARALAEFRATRPPPGFERGPN